MPSKTSFDTSTYLDCLLHDIGFDMATPQQKEQMRQELSKQVNYLITNAVSLHVEPDELDEALIRFKGDTDFGDFLSHVTEISPESQLAIIEALDRFNQETVGAYKRFKK